ncbi:hypothetical protein ACP4OV_031780 [Aristida adscensionis]
MLVAAAKIIAAALVVLLQLSGSPAAAAPAMAEHCRQNAKCGEVEVPYPFGITPNCSYPMPGFHLTCDRTSNPPRLLLDNGWAVVEFVPGLSLMVVNTTGAVHMSGGSGSVGHGKWPEPGFGKDSPFVLSALGNELVVTGSNVLATLRDTNGTIITGCSSFWSLKEQRAPYVINFGNDTTYCSGLGCCQNLIPFGGALFDVRSQWIDVNDSSSHTAMPSYVFVAQTGWYNDEVNEAIYGSGVTSEQGQRYAETVAVPVWLRWMIRPSKGGLPSPDGKAPNGCPRNVSSKICKSDHSECDASQFQEPAGYTCGCKEGYDGNPYIPGGCQDVNECKKYKLQGLGCFGVCINTDGSYKCQCPQGFQGNYSHPGGCTPIPILANSIRKGSIIAIAVGSGAGSIILVLIAIFMIKRFKHLRAKKLKQKYFKQNRGQLLQQLISQKADIAERMIIPVDELSKATNNFDKAREVGGGGHGTVYKGILSDQHVVAIKKSKITVQREIDEFINEVAILSQINHRNVVKLFGCCLETEVPLLVYEFVSNGTLYQHLHIEGPRSLSWDNRLRIATEAASALSYLHSSVSIPIIHRDIKSANILLDDMLTSKVSDFGASRYVPMDKTGLTTMVQGTIGYLDPMYFYTGRLTEKSDVYSFGIILVELLTRKKPFSYMFSECEGLVAHFVKLLAEDNLVEILDPQVKEEGGDEVQEVAELAALCTKINSEDRPTMRQVEHKLQGLQASKKSITENMWVQKIEEDGSTSMNSSSSKEKQSVEESSRRYSMEHEVLMSASYPR